MALRANAALSASVHLPSRRQRGVDKEGCAARVALGPAGKAKAAVARVLVGFVCGHIHTQAWW